MSNDQLHHLIVMVNQISSNLHHTGTDDEAAEAVAGHLKKFWARSMKQMIIEYADQDGSELSPLSREAVAKLQKPVETV
ncbi:formate dehydrogenase subunit delta [Marinobacter salinexigens]|uniref:Formate dehydrogenase subunit delta n=1 Tax=Marinobacter salinexigens TaxID=2919747 RepID=A0A5B0VI04_9GAMM|nr:formate dehydrogenase subunit delta [Marinobacter salinexigens]KAA1174252.1 formate dehydrogenase subunit delta [Marinobacter salinexigens]